MQTAQAAGDIVFDGDQMGVRQIDDGRQGVVDDHGEAQSDAGGDHLLKEGHGIGVEDIGRTADVIKDIQRQ